MLCKTALKRLAAGLLCVSTMIGPVLAATGTVNTGASKLNLRSKASTSASVLTKIPGGSTVEVLGSPADGWYQVTFNGKTGYVASQYVDVETPKYGKVTEAPLNVRSAPSTSAAKCGRLSAGQQVEILEETNGWYKIPQGYVSAQYVAPVSEQAPAASAPAVQTPAPAVQAPAEEKPSQDIGAKAAVSQPAAEQAPAEGEVRHCRITASVLNVRSGPGSSYAKVGSLRAGKVVEILGEEKGWYKISSGYISAEYAIVVSADEAANAGKGQEIADYALQFVGYRYVYGGASPKGFDCSGLTKYVYAQFGYNINRTASNQLDNGTPVSMSELQPGDLVMFKKKGTGSSRASHVGIYIGNNQFVHASSPEVGVIVSKMNSAYYTTGFVGGRRIV